MDTLTRNGLLARRLGLAFSISALPIAGFFIWLKIKYGIAYIGPIPALAFWVVPTFAGMWLVLWRQPIGSRRLWHLGVCTAAAAISVLALSFAHVMGLK